MGRKAEDLEAEIINTFALASVFLGYSEVHGKILAALLIAGKPLSLEGVAKKSGYSMSMISLSLDLLETLGTIRRVKKPKDRKLYIELHGDLLETLKAAIMLKVGKALVGAHANFEEYREEIKKMQGPEKAKLLKSLGRLEKEMRRVGLYLGNLSNVPIPK